MKTPVEVSVLGNGCWKPVGAKPTASGHVRVRSGGKKRYLHQWSYESLVGPIPEGHELHHTCLHPWCANPWHVIPVTKSEHGSIEPRRKKQRFCKRGHDTDIVGRTGRGCRLCRNMRNREWRARKKEKRLCV